MVIPLNTTFFSHHQAAIQHPLIKHYQQGLVNVLIEHHPTIGDIITNKYLKVMFKIPKTGHLPTPDNGNP